MRSTRLLMPFFGPLAFLIAVGCSVNPSFAQIERFKPREGKAIEVWRITNTEYHQLKLVANGESAGSRLIGSADAGAR